MEESEDEDEEESSSSVEEEEEGEEEEGGGAEMDKAGGAEASEGKKAKRKSWAALAADNTEVVLPARLDDDPMRDFMDPVDSSGPLPAGALAKGLCLHVTRASLVSLAASRGNPERPVKGKGKSKGKGKGMKDGGGAKKVEEEGEGEEEESQEKGATCSVRVWLTDGKGEAVGPVYEWASKRGLLPVWNSTKRLGAVPDTAGSVVVELWERIGGGARVRMAGPAVLPLLNLPQVRPAANLGGSWRWGSVQGVGGRVRG